MQALSDTFANEYLSLMEASHGAKQTNNIMSYISISTITIICDLCVSIDIMKLESNFSSPPYPICSINHTKAHDEYETSKRGKTKKSFYNQITIKFTDHTTKSIKVFSNGRLQMTGLTSISDALRCVRVIASVIQRSHMAIDTTLVTDISPQSMRIAMINSNFSFNSGINIVKLRTIIQNYTGSAVTYDPDVYPGLKMKHKNPDGSMTSVFIFSTGNVVITGSKELAHIREAFCIVTKCVNNHIDELRNNALTGAAKSLRGKPPSVYADGYKREIKECAVNNVVCI